MTFMFDEVAEDIAFEMIQRYPKSCAKLLAHYMLPLKEVFDSDPELFSHRDYGAWAKDFLEFLLTDVNYHKI